MRRRGRSPLLMSIRTAARNLDLQLAIAILRCLPSFLSNRALPFSRKLGKRESDQSRTKQHKTRNGHSQETVRSELLTHGAPPNCAPRLKRTTVQLHSQRDCLPACNFDRGWCFGATPKRARASLFPPRRHSSRLLRPCYSREAVLSP